MHIHSLATRLDTFWFTPMPATRLALLRVSTGGFALWYLLTRWNIMLQLASSPVDLFAPAGLARLLPGPVPVAVFEGLLWATLLLNIAYLLGWQFRWSGPLFALALLALLSYRNSWSMIYHNRNALVLHVLVIGLASAADAWSLDAWRRGTLGSDTIHARYGWPIRLLCLATMLAYLVSGLAKLLGDLAWSWLQGEAMRSQVAVDAIRKYALGETTGMLVGWLYPLSGLFMLMGAMTMILEVGAPLFLADRRLRIAWALLTWLMHWGIFFIMGIRFRYQMTGLIFLPFFQAERLLPASWRKPTQQQTALPSQVVA
ncbi:MAG: hypothetical protein OHK0039_03300 [Bacteroidia bacterium]